MIETLSRASRVLHLWADLYEVLDEHNIIWEDPGFGRSSAGGPMQPISLKTLHGYAMTETPFRLRRSSKVAMQVATMQEAEQLRNQLISITQQERYHVGGRKGDKEKGIAPVPSHPYRLKVKIIQPESDLVLAVNAAKSTVKEKTEDLRQMIEDYCENGYEMLDIEKKEQRRELEEIKRYQEKILMEKILDDVSASEIEEYKKRVENTLRDLVEEQHERMHRRCQNVAKREIEKKRFDEYISDAEITDNDMLTVSRYVARSFRFTYFDQASKKRKQVSAGDICICVRAFGECKVVTAQRRAERSDVDQYDDIIVDLDNYVGTVRDVQYRLRDRLYTYDNYLDDRKQEIEKEAEKIAKSKGIQR